MSFHFKEIIWRLPWSLCLVNCSFPLYILIFPASKWNKSGFMPPLCTYRLYWVRRTSWGWWMRWHCPPDTGFKIRALEVWGRARYLSVTEAPHNTEFHTWMGKKLFVSFKPPRPGTSNPLPYGPRPSGFEWTQNGWETSRVCLLEFMHRYAAIYIDSLAFYYFMTS